MRRVQKTRTSTAANMTMMVAKIVVIIAKRVVVAIISTKMTENIVVAEAEAAAAGSIVAKVVNITRSKVGGGIVIVGNVPVQIHATRHLRIMRHLIPNLCQDHLHPIRIKKRRKRNGQNTIDVIIIIVRMEKNTPIIVVAGEQMVMIEEEARHLLLDLPMSKKLVLSWNG